LSGCQFGAVDRATARPPVVGGWLSEQADGVAFLNLTIDGSGVAGTVTWVFVSGSGDHLPKTISATAIGTSSDTAVTVTLSDSPFGPVTWSGQLAANSITFAVPQAGGAIATLTFVPGTPDEYNAALGLFQANEAALYQADLDAAATAAASAAASAAAAEQAATSCSATVSALDAALVVSGGVGAVDECRSLLARLPTADGSWLSPVAPDAMSIGGLICTGERDGWSVEVVGAGSEFSIPVCKTLGLDSTIPYIGICFEDNIVIGVGPTGLRIIPCSNGPGVVPNSPAAKAGLREGDVIIELDGYKAPDHFTFDSILNPHRVGDRIGVVVLRGTRTLSFVVTLGPMPWT
jgi:PDZ domain